MHRVQIGDSFVAANGGHAAFIKIPKALRRTTLDHPENVPGRVPPLLHRYRRNARKRFLILIGEISQVADDLYFWVTRNREVIIDDDTADSIDRNTKRFTDKRRIVAGSPDFNPSPDILVAHL